MDRRTSNERPNFYRECRFLIHRDLVDDIVGDSGENLKRLHMQHRAFINISDSRTAERVLSISGMELAEVCDTLRDVMNSLGEKIMVRLEADGQPTGESAFRLLIDESEIEYLTSAEEYRLSELLEMTGTTVDVFVMCCPGSTDRVVRVRGIPRNITRCVYGVYDLLQWCSSKKQRTKYNADNADERYMDDYGGFASRPRQAGPSLQHSGNAPDPLAQMIEERGVGEGRDQQGLDVSLSEGRLEAGDEDQAKVKYSVPLTLLPVFTFNERELLQRVQKESGACIQLDQQQQQQQGGMSVRMEGVISVSGSREQVDNARHLLQMCVRLSCVRME